jgi:hypothetical protein
MSNRDALVATVLANPDDTAPRSKRRHFLLVGGLVCFVVAIIVVRNGTKEGKLSDLRALVLYMRADNHVLAEADAYISKARQCRMRALLGATALTGGGITCLFLYGRQWSLGTGCQPPGSSVSGILRLAYAARSARRDDGMVARLALAGWVCRAHRIALERMACPSGQTSSPHATSPGRNN